MTHLEEILGSAMYLKQDIQQNRPRLQGKTLIQLYVFLWSMSCI